MARNPNAAGKYNGGPHVSKGKGPIIGKNPAGMGSGTAKPWSLGQGKSKNLNFGKDVKKS
jgi:hypothetical protein